MLRGDPSDGIPGVPGFGAKTAVAVIASYGSLEAALTAVQAGAVERPLTARLAGLLAAHADLIDDMRFVATARIDAPVAQPTLAPPDEDAVADLALEWGVERQVQGLRAALGI